MTGPGRPKIGEPVQLRLPAELLTRVDHYATGHEITRAEAVRRLLVEALR